MSLIEPTDKTEVIEELYQLLLNRGRTHGITVVRAAYRRFAVASRKGEVRTRRKGAVPRPWVHAALKRQDWNCSRCRNPIEKFKDATGDHTIALDQGGEDSPENISAMHRNCNSKKGANTLDRESRKTGRTILEQLKAAKGDFS